MPIRSFPKLQICDFDFQTLNSCISLKDTKILCAGPEVQSKTVNKKISQISQKLDINLYIELCQ